MRLRLSKLLVVGVLALALLATAGSAATTQFATGMVVPERRVHNSSDGREMRLRLSKTITQTASGNIKLFTTIPVGGGHTLRQIAFAPKEWKKYGGDLFVSVNTGAIDIVNRDGVVVGKISGAFSARGLLFTTMSGQPTLLFSNILDGSILKVGPGDIVPS
jgi:hypothetical protein